MTKKKCILEMSNISKKFKCGDDVINILDGANISIYEGEIVALVGSSGCGKTTFLQIAGLLDNASGGKIKIKGKEFQNESEFTKTEFRKKNIGFIYQSHNLLSDFTAMENIRMPLRVQYDSAPIKSERKVSELLSKLGLDKRRNHYPSKLSGGEQQRVAIARSLIHEPMLLLADEPTGNLDSKNAKNVVDILMSTVKKYDKTLLMVTHNMSIANKADRVFTIEKGKIVEKKKRK
jgi:ABC-type lipoprotein export system ATPase subunit